MFADSLNTLLLWLQLHPLLALLFVFLIAFSESLIIVGIILPGAAFMLGFGALIALDVLQAGPAVIAATLGAIAGDSLSYWLGWHYKQALKTRWPFSTYPALIERGEVFFHRHGGKSVMLGRFIGPLRPIVPAIAGMLMMPRSRFIIANVASACLWAPLYLLPGYLFGLSIEVASEFAGRFLLLFALLISTLWFIIFILRQVFLWLLPYADTLFYRLLIWSQRHALVGEIPAAIVNPGHREIRGLSLLALLLLISSGLLIFLHDMIDVPLFNNTSLLIQNALFELRNPPFDQFMSRLATLAEPTPALLCAGMTLLWLLLKQRQQHKLLIQHLLAVPLLPLLLMLLPEQSPQLFSADLVLALSLYGFLLLALLRDIPVRWRMRLYASGICLIALLMFSRLYFGQIALIQLYAELSLTTLWVSALSIAYRRHTPKHQTEQHTYKLLLLLLVLLCSYPFISPAPSSLSVQSEQTKRLMDKQHWLDRGWKTEDAYRRDLRGQHRSPMNLQWADSLSHIQQQLEKQSWQLVEQNSMQYFNWLKTDADISQLPILAHVHKGRYESLTMVKYVDAEKRALIIRLWPADLQLRDTKDKLIPLWTGAISYLQPVSRFWVHYLRTEQDFDLYPQLSAFEKSYQLERKYREQTMTGWDGEVMLLF